MTELHPVCKWSYQTKGRLRRASPAIAQDGTLYAGDQEGLLYAIYNDGRLAWRRRAVGARKYNERSGQPDRLMALDRWGNKLWDLTIQASVRNGFAANFPQRHQAAVKLAYFNLPHGVSFYLSQKTLQSLKF